MLVLFDAAAQRGPGNPTGANQHAKAETVDPETGEVGNVNNINNSSPESRPTGTSEQAGPSKVSGAGNLFRSPTTPIACA